MTLREKQSAFARCIAQLVLWICDQGWEVTLADGGLTLLRKVQTSDGRRVRAIDREHMDGSLHYSRLAQDLNLFIAGQWITDGDHQAWQAIGAQWKRMDALARWGGDFEKPDANHFSFSHEGKA